MSGASLPSYKRKSVEVELKSLIKLQRRHLKRCVELGGCFTLHWYRVQGAMCAIEAVSKAIGLSVPSFRDLQLEAGLIDAEGQTILRAPLIEIGRHQPLEMGPRSSQASHTVHCGRNRGRPVRARQAKSPKCKGASGR